MISVRRTRDLVSSCGVPGARGLWQAFGSQYIFCLHAWVFFLLPFSSDHDSGVFLRYEFKVFIVVVLKTTVGR